VRQSASWQPVDVPPGTIMQDSPPSSPDPGQFWYDTDSGALFLWYSDGTSSQWIQVAGPSSVPDITPLAQCYLDVSGSNLLLSRENGNRLYINGRNETIPVAGVTLAPTGLTTTGGVGGTSFHLVYAYMNAGVMTLEWSNVTHAVDATSGIRVKSGDASRTLVGAFMAWAANQFPAGGFHTAQTCAVMSVYNPKMKRGRVIGNPATSAASYTELATVMRVFFIGFLGRPIRQIVETNAYNSVAGADIFLVTGLGGTGGTYNGPGAFRVSATASTQQVRVHIQEVLYSADGAYNSSPYGASSSGGTATFPTMENFVEVWG
jgi:hypothetical protein